MRPSPRAVLAAALGLVLAGSLVAPAQATHKANTHQGGGFLGRNLEDPEFESPDEVRGKVCPTKDFWIGDGWGADRGNRKHKGIDFGGERGTPIFAVEDGRIDRTKLQSNGSLQIVLRGDSGSKYYYGHQDQNLVQAGDRVVAGQVIGLMGDTGSPGAVHLHFEYWKSGGESDAINPARFIERICK